ncbi:MAG: hypothetical protein WCB58_21085, partial [Acidobacteriaceae bacterium]
MNEATSPDIREIPTVDKVSTWALLLPLLHCSGVVLDSSQDQPLGDLISANTTGPWALVDKSYKLFFAVIVLWLLVS